MPEDKPSIEQRVIAYCSGQFDLGPSDLEVCLRCNRKTVAHKRCIICGCKLPLEAD